MAKKRKISASPDLKTVKESSSDEYEYPKEREDGEVPFQIALPAPLHPSSKKRKVGEVSNSLSGRLEVSRYDPTLTLNYVVQRTKRPSIRGNWDDKQFRIFKSFQGTHGYLLLHLSWLSAHSGFS